MGGLIQSGPTLMPGEPRYEQLAAALASGDLSKIEKIVHPFARLLPMIPENRRETFRASLAEGQLHAVIFHKGMLLDGRNRTRELTQLRKPISTGVFVGDNVEALKLVNAENIERRHLNESQRADYYARIAMLPVGANQHTSKPAPIGAPSLPLGDDAAGDVPLQAPMISQGEAADVGNISRRSIQRATVYLKEGAPELSQAVQEGKMSVLVASDLAESVPKEEQQKIAAMGEKEILAEAKRIRKEANDKRRADRSDDIRRKAEASTALPTGQKFPLIYMDPPTKYNAGDSDRSTENHYPTMVEEEIAKLPVNELAMGSAVLLIWTTVPWFAKTLRLIEGWGFEYKSCAVWDKETIGLGFWWQNQHEILIGASRGNPVMPENGSIMGPSLYREKKTRHSAKPEYFRTMIDIVPEWKDWPKVELFPRGTLPDNWKGWGNEAQLKQQQTLGLETAEAAE
jgi:N6-adenosine-specific RNA methylase IME4